MENVRVSSQGSGNPWVGSTTVRLCLLVFHQDENAKCKLKLAQGSWYYPGAAKICFFSMIVIYIPKVSLLDWPKLRRNLTRTGLIDWQL
jgi:hypothetical protein